MKATLLSTSANQGRVPPKSRNERQKAILLKGGCDLIRPAEQALVSRCHRQGIFHGGPSLRRSFVADDAIHPVSTNGRELADRKSVV